MRARSRLLALALPLMLVAAAIPTDAAGLSPAGASLAPDGTMINFTLEVESEDFLREIAALEMEVGRKLAMTMDQVGWEVVAFLRSVGHGTQPAARPGEPSRSAHPGQWADITSNLANAFRFELYADGRLIRWVPDMPPLPEDARGTPRPVTVKGTIPQQVAFPLELRFLNGMEYAAALEARDGYWVLREITGNGGPVARAMRTVLSRVAPDAEIREA